MSVCECHAVCGDVMQGAAPAQAVLLLLPLCVPPSSEAAQGDGRLADKVSKHLCYLCSQLASGAHHHRPHTMCAQLYHPTRASGTEADSESASHTHLQAEKLVHSNEWPPTQLRMHAVSS